MDERLLKLSQEMTRESFINQLTKSPDICPSVYGLQELNEQCIGGDDVIYRKYWKEAVVDIQNLKMMLKQMNISW